MYSRVKRVRKNIKRDMYGIPLPESDAQESEEEEEGDQQQGHQDDNGIIFKSFFLCVQVKMRFKSDKKHSKIMFLLSIKDKSNNIVILQLCLKIPKYFVSLQMVSDIKLVKNNIH